MTIQQFMQTHRLDKSVLLGYYGGGNFGDELLLEIMQNLLRQHGARQVAIGYLPYCQFATYHHDMGYRTFRANSPLQLLRALLKNDHIIVGGGGIWGLDTQLRPFLLSVALWVSRWVLGKKVYLLGVGYYQSTNWLGHLGAWLAANASHVIIARDTETADNFGRFKKDVNQDSDLAWYLRTIDSTAYAADVAALMQAVPITDRTVCITLRRFSNKHVNKYTDIIRDTVAKYADSHSIVLALLEPSMIDAQNTQLLRDWQQKYPSVRVLDGMYNPIALYLFLQKYRKKIAVISPQFHAIIAAHLQDVPFLPIAYDNKVHQLYRQIGVANAISVYDLTRHQVHQFIDNFYREEA